MQAKDPIEGYVRCETLMPILGVQILPVTDMPTRRDLALLTEDGTLALGLAVESAQEIARLLEKAASEMRLADAPIFVENVKAGIAGRRCYAASTFSSSSFAVPFLLA
jgi:hypothetical protein